MVFMSPNPALQHGPETWCIMCAAGELCNRRYFLFGTIENVLMGHQAGLHLVIARCNRCFLPAYLLSLFHFVNKSDGLNYEFETWTKIKFSHQSGHWI